MVMSLYSHFFGPPCMFYCLFTKITLRISIWLINDDDDDDDDYDDHSNLVVSEHLPVPRRSAPLASGLRPGVDVRRGKTSDTRFSKATGEFDARPRAGLMTRGANIIS